MRSVVVFLLALIMSQVLIVTVDAQDVLAQQAEVAYTNGDFKLAADLYQQLIDQGVKRSEVYFNIGNAYYQLHDLGRALVNYRRAEQFTPRDEDLRLNLARIRVQRVDGVITESGITGYLVRLTSDWLSSSELSWLVIVLWWVCCGFITVYLWRTDWRKRIRWAILASSTLFVFVGVLASTRMVLDWTQPQAAIVANSVSVLTGPGNRYLDIFELHAAAEIRVVDKRDGWVRFRLPDLREGWIEEQSLEAI